MIEDYPGGHKYKTECLREGNFRFITGSRTELRKHSRFAQNVKCGTTWAPDSGKPGSALT